MGTLLVIVLIQFYIPKLPQPFSAWCPLKGHIYLDKPAAESSLCASQTCPDKKKDFLSKIKYLSYKTKFLSIEYLLLHFCIF